MILVIGIGNPARGDDAAGLAVARRIREAAAPYDVTVVELAGDQLALLDAWTGAREVYVIDAVCSGGTPGTVYRFDAAEPLTVHFWHCGTHTFSLADVIELARALGRLPARLTGFGIEGATFEPGAPLSPEVEAAVDAVTALLLRELREKRSRAGLGLQRADPPRVTARWAPRLVPRPPQPEPGHRACPRCPPLRRRPTSA